MCADWGTGSMGKNGASCIAEGSLFKLGQPGQRTPVNLTRRRGDAEEERGEKQTPNKVEGRNRVHLFGGAAAEGAERAEEEVAARSGRRAWGRALLMGMMAVALGAQSRSEEHTSELQSPCNLLCRLLLEKK